MTKRILAAALVAGLIAASAAAADFSADFAASGREGKMQGKIFSAGAKNRMEAAGAVTIVRMDRKIAWILMPEQKMYMEQPIRADVCVADKYPDEVSRELLGTETVNGVSADKYLIVFMESGKKRSVHQWMSKDGLPVRVAAVDGSWRVDLLNIKAGPQPASLFEIPAGYTKLDMKSFIPPAGN